MPNVNGSFTVVLKTPNADRTTYQLTEPKGLDNTPDLVKNDHPMFHKILDMGIKSKDNNPVQFYTDNSTKYYNKVDNLSIDHKKERVNIRCKRDATTPSNPSHTLKCNNMRLSKLMYVLNYLEFGLYNTVIEESSWMGKKYVITGDGGHDPDEYYLLVDAINDAFGYTFCPESECVNIDIVRSITCNIHSIK